MAASTLADLIRTRDPDGSLTRQSARAGVGVPAVLAAAMVVFGPGQLSVFATFAAIVLLMFVDVPGPPARRAAGYTALAAAGSVAVVAGTLASRPGWLAVLAMAVVGTVLLFLGVLSATAAEGTRVVLLVWVWALLVPGGPDDLAARLAGWGVAIAICVPTAVLLWPPGSRRDLHADSAACCRALADLLRHRMLGTARDAVVEDAAATALARLWRTYRGDAVRPVGLSVGGRTLVRLVDELERFGDVIESSTVGDVVGWPAPARHVAAASADVLDAAARALGSGTRERSAALRVLDEAMAGLADARAEVFTVAEASLREGGALPPWHAHELSQAALMTGEVVGSAVAADARSLGDRLRRRHPPRRTPDRLSPPGRVLAGHLDRHSVWLHNSLRGGAGLGLAVLVAELVEPQNAFWVALAAMSVLRSTGRSTRSTATRAVGGTVAGFLAGGAVVTLAGSDPVTMWVSLVVAVVIATAAPGVGSFVLGQACLTVALVLLFNILGPAGWQVGLVRLGDVAIGCAVGVVAGWLLWPRGARAEVGRALGRSVEAGAVFLRAAVAHVVDRACEPSPALTEAREASHRGDDAVRQYLAEHGPAEASLAELTVVIGAASQLRLVGFAIVELNTPAGDRRFEEASELITRRVIELQAWFDTAADVLRGRAPAVAPVPADSEHGDVLHALRRGLGRDLGRDPVVEADVTDACRHLWTALYLRDVRALAARVAGPVAALRGSGDPS